MATTKWRLSSGADFPGRWYASLRVQGANHSELHTIMFYFWAESRNEAMAHVQQVAQDQDWEIGEGVLEPRGVMEDWITEIAVDADDLGTLDPTFFDDIVESRKKFQAKKNIQRQNRSTIGTILCIILFGGAFMIGVPMLVYHLTNSGWYTAFSVPFAILAIVNPGQAFGLLAEFNGDD